METQATFGPYGIVSKIAESDVATSFAATYDRFDDKPRVVALKFLALELTSTGDFADRLLEATRRAVRLNHVNVAQTFDLGNVQGTYYVTLEFVDGLPLSMILDRVIKSGKPIPRDVATFIVGEICAGLAYAHGRRDERGKPLHIVHTDVQPRRVLVSKTGEVKVTDFGLAQTELAVGGAGVLAKDNRYHFVAPEIANDTEYDLRADLFSIGAVAYLLYTGQSIYDDASGDDLASKSRRGYVPAITDIDGSLPAPLADIVMKALSSDPTVRPKTATMIRSALASWLRKNSPGFGRHRLKAWLQQEFPEALESHLPAGDWTSLHRKDYKPRDVDSKVHDDIDPAENPTSKADLQEVFSAKSTGRAAPPPTPGQKKKKAAPPPAPAASSVPPPKPNVPSPKPNVPAPKAAGGVPAPKPAGGVPAPKPAAGVPAPKPAGGVPSPKPVAGGAAAAARPAAAPAPKAGGEQVFATRSFLDEDDSPSVVDFPVQPEAPAPEPASVPAPAPAPAAAEASASSYDDDEWEYDTDDARDYGSYAEDNVDEEDDPGQYFDPDEVADAVYDDAVDEDLAVAVRADERERRMTEAAERVKKSPLRHLIWLVVLGGLGYGGYWAYENLYTVAAAADVPPEPGLFVSSRPQGAEILINGVESGFTTPALLTDVEEGATVTVTVDLDGYDEPDGMSLEITRAPHAEAVFDLQPTEHSVRVDSDPLGAEVYYRGELVGVTSTTLGPLRVSHHDGIDLVVRMDGYFDERIPVDWEPGDTSSSVRPILQEDPNYEPPEEEEETP